MSKKVSNKKTIKKTAKRKEKSLEKHFTDALEMLVEHEIGLKKESEKLKEERKLFINTLVQICKDVENGIFRKNPFSEKEKTIKHKYSPESIKIAKDHLRKYSKVAVK